MQPASTPPVRISLDNGVIQVDPMRLEVDQTDTVTWDIEGAQDRDRIRIEFESQECRTSPSGPPARRRGPFAKRPPTPENPAEGVYQRDGLGTIQTTPAECLNEWKYTVFWERGGTKIDPLDPFVIIRTNN